MTEAAGITTLLGVGTRFEGKLVFQGCVRIEGEFRGSIVSADTLVIGEGADVEADTITVGTVIVRGGSVRANIKAKNAIEIYAPATVKGDLHSPSLFIDKGVAFQGSCKMDPVEEEVDAP
jgi:cytoskeletal protein CcmA (bactofilin family)